MKKNYFCIALLCLGVLGTSCDKEKIGDGSEEIREPKAELITLKSGVVVEKKGGQYLLYGDILLSDAQLKSLEETGDFFPEEKLVPVTISQQNEESIQFKNVGVYPTPLKKAVLLKRNTPYFFGNKIDEFSGVTCYIPILGQDDINGYYSKLNWAIDSGISSLLLSSN